MLQPDITFSVSFNSSAIRAYILEYLQKGSVHGTAEEFAIVDSNSPNCFLGSLSLKFAHRNSPGEPRVTIAVEPIAIDQCFSSALEEFSNMKIKEPSTKRTVEENCNINLKETSFTSNCETTLSSQIEEENCDIICVSDNLQLEQSNSEHSLNFPPTRQERNENPHKEPRAKDLTEVVAKKRGRPNISKNQNYDSKKRAFECPLCNYKTDDLFRIRPHISTRHNGKYVHCSLCEYSCGYYMKESLKRHYSKRHKLDEESITSIMKATKPTQEETPANLLDILLKQ